MKWSFVAVLVFAVILSVGSVRAVGIEIVWNRTDYGIIEHDVWVRSVMPSGEGEYILAGEANSHIASCDSYLAKIDSEGNKVWEDTYARRGFDLRLICQGVRDLAQSEDGGFVVVSSANCPVSSADHGASCEACVFKVDALGNKVLEKIYGEVHAFCIIQAGDGGFILGGSFEETLYVFKIDSQGEKIWENTPKLDTPFFYPSQRSSFKAITESGDGGYVLAGAYNDFRSVCVLKIDSHGNKVWDYTSGEGEKQAWAVTRNSEGFIAMGTSGDESLYLLGLDRDGNKTWEKVYRSSEGHDIAPSGDGFLIVGKKDHDPYFLKIDRHGDKIWSTTIPPCGNGYEHCLYCREVTNIAEAGDNEYIIAHKDYVARIKITPHTPIPELPSMGLIATFMGGMMIVYYTRSSSI